MNYRSSTLGEIFTTVSITAGLVGTASNVINHLIRENKRLRISKKIAATEAERKRIQDIIDRNEAEISRLQAQFKEELQKEQNRKLLTFGAVGGAALLGLLAFTQ